jgi:hypothetical protein
MNLAADIQKATVYLVDAQLLSPLWDRGQARIWIAVAAYGSRNFRLEFPLLSAL